MSTTTANSLKSLPHGIDITAPGGIDELLEFHRATFGDAQMNANSDDGESGSGNGEKPKPKPPRVFTQDEVNAFVAEERRKAAEKFGDYDDLKHKADKFEEQEQANQTELEKAIARAEKAEQERESERAGREAAERKSIAAEVAAEKGVPASHISGSTREELETSANQLIEWRTGKKTEEQEQQRSQVGGYIAPSGTGESGPVAASMSSGRERAEAKHAKNKN